MTKLLTCPNCGKLFEWFDGYAYVNEKGYILCCSKECAKLYGKEVKE